MTFQLLQNGVPISDVLEQDWGDTCFLVTQKRPCRALSPSLQASLHLPA